MNSHFAAAPITTERVATKMDELINWIRDYANHRINSRMIDERRCITPNIVLDFGNRGLLGMQVSEQFGGKLNLSVLDSLRVQQQLGAIDLTLAFFVGLNNALGIHPIQRFGSSALKSRYLPDLATGRILAAFALTERNAGSNPLNITCVAKKQRNTGYVLNGEKIWSGSASWAGVINVFTRLTDDTEQPRGHISFCIPTTASGVTQAEEALTLGLRGMVQNRVVFNSVVASDEQVLGVPGAGLAVGADAMMLGRLGIAAICVGGMQRCLQLMLRYTRRRCINGGALANSALTQAQIVMMSSAELITRVMVERIATQLDASIHVPSEAFACVKMAGSEWLWLCADRLLQTLGGRGYIETNCASQLLRDARITRIFEGPTESLSIFVGKRMLDGSPAFNHYMCHTLQKKAIADELQSQLTILLEANDATRNDLLYSKAGKLTMLYVALACCDTTRPYAVEWLQHQISALMVQPIATSVLDIEQLEVDLLDQIGDGEQTLPGEDVQIDPYLRKHWLSP